MSVTAKALDEKIRAAEDGNIGVMTALMTARQQLGDSKIAQFLDLVPEKGSDLWDKFKSWKKDQHDSFGFLHFIVATLTRTPQVFDPGNISRSRQEEVG